MSWEDTFKSWAQGPSQTEQEKCEHAESVVKRIIRADSRLSELPIRVFTQGSYSARTNVRLDSDVDICVCLQQTFFYDLTFSPSKNSADHGIGPASIQYPYFKNLVGAALIRELGQAGVKRGNKAFDVHANTYRIDADVVAAFEHRRYLGTADYNGNAPYEAGIEFHPDNGNSVINWPDHNLQNGIAKNDRTGRKYKRVIRILKRMRNAMQADGISAAQGVASFLIESLVWNVADTHFLSESYTGIIRSVLAESFNSTLKAESCSGWVEVNERKFLFHATQPWTREQAHGFLSAAWDYVGFK
jgi:hypothetical protein